MGPPASHAAQADTFCKMLRVSRLCLSGPSHARLPVLGGGSRVKPEVTTDPHTHFAFSHNMVHAK